MKVIHVLRKPLSEKTVAANVLAHGTGALNIDASRISTSDSLDGGASTVTHAAQKGNEGWTRPWMEDEDAREAHAERVRQNVAKAETLGRWPSNLILEHDPACRCVGTRKVKGSAPASGPTLRGISSSLSMAGEMRGVEASACHTGADGMEPMAVWDCAPGCPVVALDMQSRFYKQVGGHREAD